MTSELTLLDIGFLATTSFTFITIGKKIFNKPSSTKTLPSVATIPIKKYSDRRISAEVFLAMRRANDKAKAFANDESSKWNFEPGITKFLEEQFTFFNQFGQGVKSIFRSEEENQSLFCEKIQKHILTPEIMELRVKNLVRDSIITYLNDLSKSLDIIEHDYEIINSEWQNWKKSINCLSKIVANYGEIIGSSDVPGLLVKYGLPTSTLLLATIKKQSIEKSLIELLSRLFDNPLPIIDKITQKTGLTFLKKIAIKSTLKKSVLTMSNIVSGPWGWGLLALWIIWDYNKLTSRAKDDLSEKLKESLNEIRLDLVNTQLMDSISQIEKQIINTAGTIRVLSELEKVSTEYTS